jgi:organic radical activating enzyme
MKTYKLITDEIVNHEKGMINSIFTRFIGTADSLFPLFMRSCGYRADIPDADYEFVIFDKNPKHLKMFQEMLKWDGVFDPSVFAFKSGPEPNFASFFDHVNQSAAIADVTVEKFFYIKNRTIGKIARHGFVDFKKCWDKFRQSKFTFIHIDVIKENQEFLEILYKLSLDIKGQFVRLNFNPENSADYSESIDNILHSLWLRSFKSYSSIVEIADSNNKIHEDYAGKIYAKRHSKFCILPWMHVQYKPSGQAKLCCRYDTVKESNDWQEAFDKNQESELNNLSELYQERSKLHLIQNNTIEDSFYSNYWNKARSLTLENKPISGCHKCYLEEDHNADEVAISMRLGSSILYNDGYLHKRPGYEKPKIEFLEVGFGNYCNLACLTCNSTLSTTWHDDEVKLNAIADKPLQRLIFPKLDNLKFEPNAETLKTLRLIKFTGGEPMINPEFIKFIDLICEQGTPENISLEIYTNCSYIPSQKLLTNLTRFKDVQLNLSIDAYGISNDYIRYGSSWESNNKQTVVNSMNYWLEHGKNNSNFHIIMSTTLSLLNVFQIPKLMTWWFDTYRDSGNKVVIRLGPKPRGEYDGFFKLQMAFDPNYISVDCLPASYYKELIEWCDNYEKEFMSQYTEYEALPECLRASVVKLKKTLSRCRGNVKNSQLFLDYLSKMDSIRGNSAEATIPEPLNKVKQYLQAQDKQT